MIAQMDRTSMGCMSDVHLEQNINIMTVTFPLQNGYPEMAEDQKTKRLPSERLHDTLRTPLAT